MSITRRILESAQSGISKLTSLVIVDDEPLNTVETAALQAELAARKAARERSPRAPLDNPLAKLATSDPASRAAREKAARDRAARVHKDRDDHAARQKSAADDAFRRMKDQAARGGGSTSSGSSAPPRQPRPGSSDAQLLEWYKVLDLQLGADMPTIKTAYRKMMRKYHPDMHQGSPQKLKAANEMSMRVTGAYNGLVAHLENHK